MPGPGSGGSVIKFSLIKDLIVSWMRPTLKQEAFLEEVTPEQWPELAYPHSQAVSSFVQGENEVCLTRLM